MIQPASIAAVLALTEVAPDVFRTRSKSLLATADARGNEPSRQADRRRVYGGQLLSQALRAALYTVPEHRVTHSLHAYFISAADGDQPLEYRVERVRDGRSVSNRRVVGWQGDQQIVTVQTSFHSPRPGLEHQDGPDGSIHHDDIPLATGEAAHAWSGVELKFGPSSAAQSSGTHAARRRAWMRVPIPLGDDAHIHACVLAYASDLTILRTALVPHAGAWNGGQVRLASLDHALWMHRPVRVDQWLLLESISPIAGDSRGLTLGSIFHPAGRLVATIAQEGLMRQLTT